MTTNRIPLPTLRADLVLIHAPAFFDFRERRDIYFPFLGTSGDVPITPLYEYFPVGFKTLQRFLGERGHDVRIINLSSVLLRFPKLDFDALLRALDAPVVGHRPALDGPRAGEPRGRQAHPRASAPTSRCCSAASRRRTTPTS